MLASTAQVVLTIVAIMPIIKGHCAVQCKLNSSPKMLGWENIFVLSSAKNKGKMHA